MILIPAVDIKSGKCVRLLQGRQEAVTVFSDDPAAMAAQWEAAGAEIIHVIDLDGAFQKKPRNLTSIKGILDQVKVPIQLGGGIRKKDTIRMYLDMGVSRVILGTEAARNPQMVKETCKTHPGRIIVGIDARRGKVAIDGWTKTTSLNTVELAQWYENCGVAAIIFTDIQRDGMQTGPNVEETRRLAEAVSIPVIASGGLSSLEDLKKLVHLQKIGVKGIISGRALYSGAIEFKEALSLLKSE